MKKKSIKYIASAAALAGVLLLASAMPGDDNITKEGNTVVVNTKGIVKGVKGYRGSTPVKIYIKKNKIVKVEAVPNHETPKFFVKAKAVLSKFNGKSVKAAQTMQVDGVTGATLSAEALVKNVKEGLAYYEKNK